MEVKLLHRKVNVMYVNDEVFKFMLQLTFGKYDDVYDAAINKAYKSLNRTIRFGNTTGEKRNELRQTVVELITKSINELNENEKITKCDFNAWHKNLCLSIVDVYNDAGITFYCGQAQKWVNMTLKFLYILDYHVIHKFFHYCHVPVDNYILDAAERIFGIPKPDVCWSRWEDYDNEYMTYQNTLCNMIDDQFEIPLRWEFREWLEASNM